MIAHHGAPGLGSSGEPRATFGPLADAFRVIVFDARGSGASEGREPYTHEQWVADVDGVRAWAGAERIVHGRRFVRRVHRDGVRDPPSRTG